MTIDNKILAVAIASLLVGGGAVAAYNAAKPNTVASNAAYVTAAAPASEPAMQPQPAAGVDVASNAIHPQTLAAVAPAVPVSSTVAQPARFAQITKVREVKGNSTQYANVLSVDPVNQAVAQTAPRQECREVAVQRRLPERDGNVGGTVVGAVIGGLVGNQVGRGKGRDLATVGGAVAGGVIGNRVDRAHVGGRVVNDVERQCDTVTDTINSSKVVGYDVTYRNPDGSVGSKRMASRPGSRIQIGTSAQTLGYDVTYRLDGRERVVRLNERPTADRFPVVDGRVVTRI